MKAYLEMIRPSNSIMAGFAVFLSGMIAAGRQVPPLDVFLAVIGTIAASSAGMVMNDYFDYDIDSINKPQRPLPSGAVTRRNACIFALLLFGLAFLFIAFTNWICILIGYPAIALIFVYSWKLKRSPLSGNFVVAFLTSLTLVYGGAAAGKVLLVSMLAVSAFFANFSREIAKDIEDIEGDQRLGSRTLPILWGVGRSAQLSAVCLVLGIVATFLPYSAGIFGWLYLVLVIPVDALMVYAVYLLLKMRMDKITVVQKLEKAGMYSVLVIFFVSKMLQ
ncbi:MAG: geranylgeranylglycerol-phosphate geranylgeranyltransferase [Theionarchaea archaeon]|nr:geranylgeranylglycerol-phosphate geranylgeranyltransferase [Theionarchaea archaeon]MBU7038689.1 geranylgeranylglycerol-phosphate geranylgeranyltransferase [Theionarchaea archaeon]